MIGFKNDGSKVRNLLDTTVFIEIPAAYPKYFRILMISRMYNFEGVLKMEIVLSVLNNFYKT